MEPGKQIEVQLGHMCNNRCVFCVSGQETALGRARPMDVSPIIAEITKAHADGHRKLTLLGGEPTLQPGFMDVVRAAVALGFEEIVIFTNGVKTAREAFLDEIIATGGHFTWRISIQGATKDAHERTTVKDGSFDRIVRTMELLQKKGERITVNMCVVGSNFASVGAFPELLLRVGAQQLHLDMIRPLDAGARSEDELRAMIPYYPDMVPALEQMVAGFPESFDVNIGNLPYCIAPTLARVIHHDGQRTLTIAVDNENTFSKPWDKYLVKKRDKVKPDGCKACVFESRCSGVYEAYRHFHGTEALVPVTPERLREVDPQRRLLALHLRPLVAGLSRWAPPAPFEKVTITETGDDELTITLTGAEPMIVALRPAREIGVGSFDVMSVQVRSTPRDRASAQAALEALWAELARGGHRVLHPVGGDALGGLARSVGVRVGRLRAHAPFGALTWTELRVLEAGRRAEAVFVGPSGEQATVWLAEQGGKPSGSYRIDRGEPTPALVDGLREVMAALRAREGTEPQRATTTG